jgi:curved DNA-binding protein CbpA
MAPRARFEKDYYAVIGVGPEATADDIRRAYRRLALECHPDRNPGDPEAGERFKEVSEAYAVLIDPAKRRAYDQIRRAGAPGDFRPRREDLFRDLFADPVASAIFEDIARELGRLGLRVDRYDFRQTLFGGRAVVTGGVVVIGPLTPLRALVRLALGPLLRASLGRLGRWLLGLPAPARGGDALARGDTVVPLRLTRDEAEQGGRRRVTIPGEAASEEILVTIPRGVRTGTRLRVRGKGRAGPSGARGDAYLAVEVGE